MDSKQAQETLLEDKSLGRIYGILCKSLGRTLTCVGVISKQPDGRTSRAVLDRFNQRHVPNRYIFSDSNLIPPSLNDGWFLVQISSNFAKNYQVCHARVERKGPLFTLTFRDPVPPALQNGLNDWLEQILGDVQRPVRRCLALKEELMANRWHPDRILKLIDDGFEDGL